MLEQILNEARTFYINARRSKRRITWNDYEHFKIQLHDNCLYGYEKQLADILHI